MGSAGEKAPKLASFPVDPTEVSVAGFSSGSFMANQLHVAHSAGITGAAMIAGGLYGCAVGDLSWSGALALASNAIGNCQKVPYLLEDVSFYADLVRRLVELKRIDPETNLARSRLYFFTGGSDAVVQPEVLEKSKDVYLSLGVPASNIVFEKASGPAAHAGHAWVTVDYGQPCESNQAPFINKCAYDQAKAELKAIYGDLLPRSEAPSGRIVVFDQTEFVAGGAAAANGLADKGYLYVPKDCEAGAINPCRLQIVLHGCLQSAEALGDVFYSRIGVNEWADSNGIIVLYPQAHATKPEEIPPNLGTRTAAGTGGAMPTIANI